MPIENDFIPFAVGGSANVISQATYAADTTLTQGGFTSGIATSAQLNKVWRQSSIMAAVIASFIVAETGQTAIDDGTTATLLANFTAAVNAASKNKIVLTDTGTANAYAAANPVPLTALPTTTGFTQTVKIAHLNTGTSTYAPDGLAAAPIYSLAGALLQGNELPVNGVATLFSFIDPLLNSGSLCWVLYECVGGAQPVAPATASQHAVQLGQLYGGVKGISEFTSSSTMTAPATTLYLSGCAGGGGGGGTATIGNPNIISGASGGGAGQPAIRKKVTCVIGETLTITIGAAGAAGALNAAGGTGGTTSVVGSISGTLLTLSGGTGGLAGNAASYSGYTAGAVGGAGYPSGAYGQDTGPVGIGSIGGSGASGPFGGGGFGGRGCQSGNTMYAGQAANGYGSGGGGSGGNYAGGLTTTLSSTGNTGGAAAPGLMIIEW